MDDCARHGHNVRMPSQLTLLLSVMLLAAAPVAAREAGDDPVQTLTIEELERYRFQHRVEEMPVIVSELNVGQRATLEARRREVRYLIARQLGIRQLYGDDRDLNTIQQIIDRKVLGDGEVGAWQAVGVVFGDILAAEHGLVWVSYEDDRGASKALRWRKTENYVFPVTLFSKRVQFKERLNAEAIYRKLVVDINEFKRLPSP